MACCRRIILKVMTNETTEMKSNFSTSQNPPNEEREYHRQKDWNNEANK